jgi:hypothetical protein
MVTRITTHRTVYDSASKTLDPQLAVPAADLDQDLFISFATPSEYVRRAELADLRIGERTGERVNISAVTDTVEMECEDLPLPLAYAGDKKVKRFHFSEIIGRLSYVRATVTVSQVPSRRIILCQPHGDLEKRLLPCGQPKCGPNPPAIRRQADHPQKKHHVSAFLSPCPTYRPPASFIRRIPDHSSPL